jgi:Ca2+/Na+ antiporter
MNNVTIFATIFGVILSIFFILLDPIHNIAKEKFISPIGESITKFTLVQTTTFVVFIYLTLEKTFSSTGIIGLIMVIVLILCLIVLTAIYGFQREATHEHLEKTLQDIKIIPNLDNNLKMILVNIGKNLCDPDFIPDSFANEWSKIRKRRRELFASLLNYTIVIQKGEEFKQEMFLIKDSKISKSVKVQYLINTISIICFIIYLFAFIIFQK